MKYEESMQEELKEIVTNDLKKEIVAFANTKGGTIYIGICDDGRVIGVKNIDEEIEKVGNMIRDGILPDLTQHTKIEIIKENQHDIIKITVQQGVRKPYYLSNKGLRTNDVYVRHGVSSVPASEYHIRDFITETYGIAFDQTTSINQDLTFSYLEYIFKSKNIVFEKANKRSLFFINEDTMYTNMEWLLLDQCAHSIKYAVFQGDGKLVFKARKEFGGSLLKQLDECITYLDMYSNDNTQIQSLVRVDQPDYPIAVLREALLNAVIHRDYSYTGSTLINIYDERIEIISLGNLVKGLSYEDITSGVSQTRNTKLANIFYRLEYVESYGTGIQRMMEFYKDAQRKPTIKLNPASFIVEIPKYKKESLHQYNNQSREAKVLRRIKEEGRITRKKLKRFFHVLLSLRIG